MQIIFKRIKLKLHCLKHQSIEFLYQQIRKFKYGFRNQAASTQAPPTALIFLSAILLKNLALTTTG